MTDYDAPTPGEDGYEPSERQETTAVAIRRPEAVAIAPRTVDDLCAQMDLIQDAAARAMKVDVHYGVIPGTDKPTLLKAGAEKLSLLFRLRPTFAITRRDLSDGHREYEIVCTLTNQTGGQEGQGVGLCSTMESRYRWRKAERVCPACGATAIIKGKADWGGGWICWAKKGGCGAKYSDGDSAIESQDAGRVENPDLADVMNTVLKISKKRAFVDAILTATAAGDIWTQDMEDMGPPPTEATKPAAKPPVTMPKKSAKMTADERKRFGAALADLAFDREPGAYEDAVKACGYTVEKLDGMADSETARIAYRAIKMALDAKDDDDEPLDFDMQQ